MWEVYLLKSYIKLYNLIFPIWFLLLLPMSWLVILPANYIIDSIVLLITLSLIKQDNKKAIYKKTILKVWFFGFLSDFIGFGLLFVVLPIDSALDDSTKLGNWWYEKITTGVSYNPFDNIWSFLWVFIAILIAMFFIYWLNMKFSFKRLEVDLSVKRKMAITLAVFTAPYLFMLPTKWFY